VPDENLSEPVLADWDTLNRDDFCLRHGCIGGSWVGVYSVGLKAAQTLNDQHKAHDGRYLCVCLYVCNQTRIIRPCVRGLYVCLRNMRERGRERGEERERERGGEEGKRARVIERASVCVRFS
jgi:hypothetical protein